MCRSVRAFCPNEVEQATQTNRVEKSERRKMGGSSSLLESKGPNPWAMAAFAFMLITPSLIKS